MLSVLPHRYLGTGRLQKSTLCMPLRHSLGGGGGGNEGNNTLEYICRLGPAWAARSRAPGRPPQREANFHSCGQRRIEACRMVEPGVLNRSRLVAAAEVKTFLRRPRDDDCCPRLVVVPGGGGGRRMIANTCVPVVSLAMWPGISPSRNHVVQATGAQT